MNKIKFNKAFVKKKLNVTIKFTIIKNHKFNRLVIK